MKGTLYGVGVGPGDPKQMTYLAVETIEKCPVLAIPAEGKESAVSYKIASGLMKDLDRKECLNLVTPMTKDQDILNAAYTKCAELIIEKLDQGEDVAYLTLGDPTIYSTYIYVHRIVREKGYPVEIINGIPSFCAVSAKLGDSLVDRSEQLHVIPSTYDIEAALEYSGTKVLMKAASKMNLVKQKVLEKGLEGKMVENCGMETEAVHQSIDDIPEKSSYYSILVLKEEHND